MSDASWYYEDAGRQAGPVTLEALLELARTGRLAPTARVWRAGLTGWLPWTTVPELATQVPPPQAPPGMPPPLAAPAAPPYATDSYAADVLSASAGAALYPKAPLGGRFLAWLVDTLILVAACLPWAAVGGAIAAGSNVLAFVFGVVALATTVWALIYSFTKDGRPGGQSIGKKSMGLMVVHLPSNQPCTMGQSALRYLVLFLCNLVPYIGWLVEPVVLLAAAGGRRLGDQAAGTQVIEASAYRRRG